MNARFNKWELSFPFVVNEFNIFVLTKEIVRRAVKYAFMFTGKKSRILQVQ